MSIGANSETPPTQFFEDVAENAPFMIWRAAADSSGEWFNRPWLEFVGRTMQQEIGSGWAQSVHPDDLDYVHGTYSSAFEARAPFTLSYRMRRHDGVYRDMLAKGAPFFRDEAFAGYVGSCLDVTELHAAQEQLRRVQKTEIIARVSAGVAHDFRNVLAELRIALRLIARKSGASAEIAELLTDANRSIARGMALTNRVAAYTRNTPRAVKAIDLRELLHDTESMLQHVCGARTLLNYDVAPGLWRVVCDPAELEVALLNLAINARDAIDDWGTVTVRARNLPASRRKAHDTGGGEYVVLSMIDSGKGMEPNQLDKALEPFFTTKPPGEGTGLGLSIVSELVKQWGGDILIESQVGVGTRVHLLLPRSKALRRRPAPPHVSRRAPAPGKASDQIAPNAARGGGCAARPPAAATCARGGSAPIR